MSESQLDIWLKILKICHVHFSEVTSIPGDKFFYQ